VVILTDTSAWIEYLRGTGSEINVRVRAHHELIGELAVTEVVAMELYAGVRNPREEQRVRQLVQGVPMLTTNGLDDYEHAASLFRACRRGGETVRKLVDCLIAAVAIRNDVPVLHHDTDFDVLARHTPLRVA
jgi:predicted nucleic acid-binding protein